VRVWKRGGAGDGRGTFGPALHDFLLYTPGRAYAWTDTDTGSNSQLGEAAV